MSDIVDGWYKQTRDDDVHFNRVKNGYVIDGDGESIAPVVACIQWGWTFEPAVVMTRAEYEAALSAATHDSDPSALRAVASDYDAALEHGDFSGVEG